MERFNIIESALNNFYSIITRTPTLVPALADSTLGLIPESAISPYYQAVQSISQYSIAVQNCKREMNISA